MATFLLLLLCWRSVEVLAAARPARTILNKLKADCTNEGIRVNVEFNSPFQGVAYSLGHYDQPRCRYITNDLNTQRLTNYTFLIPVGECGTIYQDGPQPSTETRKRQKRSKETKGQLWDKLEADPGNEIFMENTLLIQSDPTIQEAGDLAQKLRCVWHKTIHKPLTASLPYRETSKPVGYRGESKYGTVSAISGVRRQQTSHRHHTHFQPHRRQENHEGHQPIRYGVGEKVEVSRFSPPPPDSTEEIVVGKRKGPGGQNTNGRRKWSRSIHQEWPIVPKKNTGKYEMEEKETKAEFQISNGSSWPFPLLKFVVPLSILALFA